VVLIVDDQPDNLRLLNFVLKKCGLATRMISDSTLVLPAVEQSPPDLILLDIMMPVLDGFAVCRQLKADARWRDIPVIFITALDGTGEVLSAFQYGAVDYITKPFQVEEVEARVRTHLALRQKEQELARALARQKQFEEWRHIMSQMIVHDLRSPLMVISTYLTMLETADEVKLPPPFNQYVGECQQNLTRAVTLADDILLVGKLEAGKMSLHLDRQDLAQLLRQEVDAHRNLTAVKFKKLALNQTVAAAQTPVRVDAPLLRRVLANLLGNAIKYSPTNGTISLRITHQDRNWLLQVRDKGPGIPPTAVSDIFEPYHSENHPSDRPGIGLGLTLCKLVIKAHGGDIGVRGEAGGGSTFWFTLPAA